MFNLGSTEPVVGKASVSISSPPEEVFDFIGVNFFINYPKWSPEVIKLERLTDGPVQLRTLARQVRVDQGRRSESKFRVTKFEVCKCICFAGLSDPYRCTYNLQSLATDNATRLTFTFELLEIPAFVRPFEKLARVALREGAERTVNNIKRLIEAPPSTDA